MYEEVNIRVWVTAGAVVILCPQLVFFGSAFVVGFVIIALSVVYSFTAVYCFSLVVWYSRWIGYQPVVSGYLVSENVC